MTAKFHLLTAMRWLGICIFCGIFSSCGGGGGSTPIATPPPPPLAPLANSVILQSEAGDSVGLGQTYSYTSANAEIKVTVKAGVISVVSNGDEDWIGDFQLASGGAPQVGANENALYYPVGASFRPAMRWYGVGRGCSTATGSFWVDHVGLSTDGSVISLILRFERRCNGSSAALRGEIRWLATDATVPPPISSPPDSLWRPAAGATPASGNYVHLVSDVGDIVGLGRTRTYTQMNARLIGSGNFNFFEISVDAEQSWKGIINGRNTVQEYKFQRGYYPDLAGYPFPNPTRGGLAWVGEGRGCADVRGWIAIDRLEYDSAGWITEIEFRFEQRCDGSSAALHGAVRWIKADAEWPTTPSADSVPGSWRPPEGATPSSGTYVYLSGENGDFISAGSTYIYTPVDAVIGFRENDGGLLIDISAQTTWGADIRPAASGAPIRRGLYTELPRASNAAANFPHFMFSGSNQACGDSKAWLAVDDVVYVNNRMSSIDFRFEQRCSGIYGADGLGAMRGEVRWRADDIRGLPFTGSAVPTNFWRPAPKAVPSATGINYVRTESMRSDEIGAGLSTTYTQATAGISTSIVGNQLHIEVRGDEYWDMDFQGIAGHDRLEPGYYADVKRYPFHNPARGGMNVGSDGRGCNKLQGGFVIDSINYTAQGALSAVQLRFEQHCENSPGALWGEVRWAQGDTSVPPGPVTPPPGLWQPEQPNLPSSGNYLYFQSLLGDYIGERQTLTLTSTNSTISLRQNQFDATATFKADVGTAFPWQAEFKVMSSLTKLQPGYYGNITGNRFQNPAKGGLFFSGDGRGCNTIDGWFVVDSIGYSGDTITKLNARFEQVCEGHGILRAQINWQQP